MKRLPEKCPICKADIVVTRVYCPSCETAIESHFQPIGGPFADLNEQQKVFVLNFVRCEGRFNRLEEEMGLSYPTLRNRLYEVIRALGFEPGKEEDKNLTLEERRQILDDLEKGKINTTQAQQLLQGLELEFKKGS